MYYPWTRARAALERLATGEGGSPYDGVIMEYTNPRTGGAAMSTMACFIQLLRPGQHTFAHRHTTSTVYHVVEGRGSTRVGDTVLEWEEKDTFCVPGWAFHEHVNASPTEPCFLFSFTDAPVIKGLQLYREERHPCRPPAGLAPVPSYRRRPVSRGGGQGSARGGDSQNRPRPFAVTVS